MNEFRLRFEVSTPLLLFIIVNLLIPAALSVAPMRTVPACWRQTDAKGRSKVDWAGYILRILLQRTVHRSL
jgi:hypothetical protein